MRSSTPPRRIATRILATFLAWTFIFGQTVQVAYAATTALADVPIAAKVAAKPNIVYTLDDSGSMQYNFLPDYANNTAPAIPLSNLTRSGTTATASGTAANIALVNVGDWVTVEATGGPAEFNGAFLVTAKPTATTFTYTLPSVPASNSSGTKRFWIGAMYCRSGNTTVACPQQAVNISTGVAINISSITRAAGTGPVLATATGTAANFALLNTGDSILIRPAPASTSTSYPYFGVYTITKISPTQFTYTITALASPLTANSAAGTKQFVLYGSSFAPPPMHAAEFNRLAYNPNVTYVAPVGDNGLPLTKPGTDANGNYGTNATFWGTASVERDPYASFEVAAGVTPMWGVNVRDNMGIKVQVPVYCNTDWPLLNNDPNWPGGPNGVTVLDVGNSNGQYLSGTGAWCRINGTQYDASAASGAPAVVADYNYPWQKSTGANDPQYFYRQLSTKVLWCDATSPNRPQRNGTIIGCTMGGTLIGGTTTPQVCRTTTSNVCNPTASLRNYTPASCSPSTPGWVGDAWCLPGTGGSGSNTPGTGLVPECDACTCNNDFTNTSRACRISHTSNTGTGGACTIDADCPDYVTGATTCSVGVPIYSMVNDSFACDKYVWDPIAGAPTTTTLLDDANGDGLVCRHNNQTYTFGGAAGLFKYPGNYAGEGSGTGNFNQGTSTNCPLVGTAVAIPRHYYTADSVQFCDGVITTANDQWRGFGSGACQDKNDLTQFRNVKYGQLIRHDLFATNPQGFPANDQGVARDWLAAVNPGPENSESINYANWYAYYSTRLLAAKTTSSIAFSYLTQPPAEPIAYRVGFHNLGEEPASVGGGGTPIIWVDVADWDLTQRTAFYNALFGIAVTNFKTPSIDAMLRIGNLFETGGAAGVDAKVNPLPATAADPIVNDGAGNPVSCQNNYHILFTDGKTNQLDLPTTVGDLDETIPASLATIPETPFNPDQVLPNLKLGGTWLAPFKQGAPAVPNTLADVATYYWATDLRDSANPKSKNSLKNDVPSSSGKVATVGVSGQGDLDWTKDVAYWQHVNFNAISFGTEGVLDASNQVSTINAILGGTQSWPDLTQPNDPIYPLGASAGAVAVDDLWRATLMSRGRFVNARTPMDVAVGLSGILSGITNNSASRVGPAFSGRVLSPTNNVIYIAKIEPGWAGDLRKIEVDPATGAEVQTWWKAADTLKAQIDPVATGVAEPWMDEAHRRVVTLTGATGPGVPFRQASLSAPMLASLANTTVKQEKVISYLRGGNTYTDSGGTTTVIEGAAFGQFRQRSGALGDISNAQPVIVQPGRLPDKNGVAGAGPQVRPYVDATDPGYSAYANSVKLRSTRVVAPANDGMVHVFDAGPVTPLGAGGGTEVFAYIPRALFRGTAGNIATEDVTALQALTYQDGGVPIFHHHMYVDSSPRVADVDFSGGSGTDWRTIVVGGLGKGGGSYYALDLTSAGAADESAAAAKVLWEWDGKDENGVQEVRYSFGRPVIVKVRDSSYPTGRWVVIVTGGYNNVTGLGKVFFLDATNGTLISTVTTSAGSATDPSGLAQIHAFVKTQSNQIAEQIYGGDLLGNFWRIDVSADDSYKSATAELFATLTDPSGVPQPVTTAPQIEIDINNGVDRYVFIGTGRLLHDSDLVTPSPPQTQTMYAMRDGTLNQIMTSGLPVVPRTDLVPINPDGVSAIVGGAPNGWYHDLPNVVGDAERIVVDVTADVNIAAYIGTRVQDDPCLIALPGRLYAHDYTSGRSLLLDSGGSVIAYLNLPAGGTSVTIVGRIQADGTQTLGAVAGKGDASGGIETADIRNPVTGPGSRLSWRLLAPE